MKRGFLKYLESSWGGGRRAKIAWERLRIDEKESIYWENDKKRKYRVCVQEETLKK